MATRTGEVRTLWERSRQSDMVWDTAKILVGVFAGIALAAVNMNVSSTRAIVVSNQKQMAANASAQQASDSIRDRTVALLQAEVQADHATQQQNIAAIQNMMQELIHNTDAINDNHQSILLIREKPERRR